VPPGSTFSGIRHTFENQTIRHVVRVSVGGHRVRVRLSNAFGKAPLRIGSAHVARHDTGTAIVPETDRVLTFGGRPFVVVPVGASALSDPADVEVPNHGRLAVSIYLPNNTGEATFHEVTRQTSYIAATAGDFTGAIDMPGATPTVSRFFLNVVEVSTLRTVGGVVAFGDSITVGARSTVDTYRTWPDQLSNRLNRFGVPRIAVLNQGVGCSRLLFDLCGQNGSARFDRDVLAAAGATHLVIALGLNDIGIPVILNRPAELVSAEDIIAGIEQLIDRARANGLEVIGATITPVGSSIFPGFFTPENEAKRVAVNEWIRTTDRFDAVADFDRVARDPADPTRLLPAFASDDGVHLNDAGYQALANAFNLSWFW
jgi:lysophospholipase L1-like esterase